tara:strand:- start:184 stop:369 length:186 start_codon:yes stop_codon:yes gene_type:complete
MQFYGWWAHYLKWLKLQVVQIILLLLKKEQALVTLLDQNQIISIKDYPGKNTIDKGRDKGY